MGCRFAKVNVQLFLKIKGKNNALKKNREGSKTFIKESHIT